VVAGLYFVNCKKEKECPEQPVPPTPEELIEGSLHYTLGGKRYWYSKEQGGFENISNIPFDDLTCKNCHVEPDDCGACHVKEGDVPTDNACLGCHGRQKKEQVLGYSDVHRDMGFVCAKCHNADDVHGDGNTYTSMLSEGAINIDCRDCHKEEELPSNSAHDQHLDDIDCSACHTQSVVSCYNCHFESEVEEGVKKAYGAFHGWKFLVKRDDGKIHSGNIMTLSYQGKAFVAIAPFYAHTIYKPDPNTICDECHDNAIVQEYNSTGKMTVVWWNPDSLRLEHYKGTIPVPSDWKTAMKFSFVTLDTAGNWIHLKDDADLKQMLFAEPLDELPPQF
jgi:hypothetical protein